jgi:hypothetical protein
MMDDLKQVTMKPKVSCLHNQVLYQRNRPELLEVKYHKGYVNVVISLRQPNHCWPWRREGCFLEGSFGLNVSCLRQPAPSTQPVVAHAAGLHDLLNFKYGGLGNGTHSERSTFLFPIVKKIAYSTHLCLSFLPLSSISKCLH